MMRPRTRSRLQSFLFYIPFALPLWKAMTGSRRAVADMRRSYRLSQLVESSVAADPLAQFETWFNEAVLAEVLEPNAMTLATADQCRAPSARTVLLKGYDARGFVFYTNYESRKGGELRDNPQASLLFTWLPLERQIEIRGAVEKVSREETETYFYKRPIDSQLGAWASHQSSVLPNREELEKRIERLMVEYRGKTVPVPSHWGGYRVVPTSIEFWQGRPSRLHDRLRYTRQPDGLWTLERLSP
jgi:pyridoxamine 5'-phosphate oxidase